MPNPLNNAVCGDDYTDAATIKDIWNSRGGWFTVASQSVYVEQQYGQLGSPTWTAEQLLGSGASGYVAPACRGIRFRNATAGQVATVAAAIAEGDEPPLQVLSLGTTVTLPSSLNFQHNDVAVATEPTIDIEDSTDATVTWAVVDDAANTRVKVMPSLTLAAVPGGIASKSPSAGFGYATGAGGTVTQLTNKSATVAINKITGQITMNNAALAGGASVNFGVTNTTVGANDVVVASIVGPAGTSGSYAMTCPHVSNGGGGFRLFVTNTTGGSLSDALLISFAVVKVALT